MADGTPFEVPEIADEDINWATSILGLPENAFLGKDGTDPRNQVLKEKTSIDVSACPGSGKTTLLVAKLAILARKWNYRTRGICVLSHTNAARDEIEKRLGHSAVGRILLSYPHFVGTIHSFVNHFFALPWLRSKGYPIKMVDTDVCQLKRWNSLSYGEKRGLDQNRHSPKALSIKSPDFSLGKVRWGRGCLQESSQTYQSMKDACRLTTEQGYFCYDEMFIWANELIQKRPEMLNIIRNRFPMLFIDETQDNSEPQSQILYTLFRDGGNATIRQRFGDENQAIYDFIGAEGASTDKFPIEDVKREIPNSHRFCQVIAKLAGPLGLNSDTCDLIGEGPKKHPNLSQKGLNPNTIFLFDEATIPNVLNAYGELIIKTFPIDFIQRGVFTAVGLVHRNDNDTKRPRHVGHYWPDYDQVLCSKMPKPDSFLKYLYAGIGMAHKTMEAAPYVEMIAQGILRLSGMGANSSISPKKGHSHRRVLKLLEDYPQIMEDYGRIIHSWVVDDNLPTTEMWEKEQSIKIRKIAETISGGELTEKSAKRFMRWEGIQGESSHETGETKCRDNFYRYTEGGKTVKIRVGSIHSVKGETHDATLVLETYWHDHNLHSILNWLCDARRGCRNVGVRIRNRLKIHYVAMTRPSYLLCLAMKKTSFENAKGEVNSEIFDKLSNLGWSIVQV